MRTVNDRPPEAGMQAELRNRRALVTAVEPFGGSGHGVLHLVTVEYFDNDGVAEDRVIWEREPDARVYEPTELPSVDTTPSMQPAHFDAMIRATRWSALRPYVDSENPGSVGNLPLAAPLHGAIQVEDYQLVPLLKALRMPRVSLFLADDVGLGKTIEAGLILQELLLRRRIRRVMILCPASLRTQWQQEMKEKFCLPFDVVDRDAIHKLQKQVGMDANAWRLYPRVITNFEYLRQPDVFESFRAASQTHEQSAHLPWDLLIVDEAHNLAPAPMGEASEQSKMLRDLCPMFEHRLFLSATPHNGHTRSFTGLLETLDPVRFTRKSDALTESERGRIEHVLIRRLKSEINEAAGEERFAQRNPPKGIELALAPEELALAEAFADFRAKTRSLMAQKGKTEGRAGSFAIEILGKRLLSSPTTFADSWHRYMIGMLGEEAGASISDVTAAQRSLDAALSDDQESETRFAHASSTVGSWMKALRNNLDGEITTIGQCLDRLGLSASASPLLPSKDTRFSDLNALIERLLRTDGAFRNDERLIIFTEYKTTLDYLHRRLTYSFPEPGRIRVLFGSGGGTGLSSSDRDEVKNAFNDPDDAVRILIATDAASEGLNLHETARYMLHFDIPWNPARLEQRNGRLDRHGQARDVSIYHFTSKDDADLQFMGRVVEKVDTIRNDLGSCGELLDRAVERRLIFGEDVNGIFSELESGITKAQEATDTPRNQEFADGVKQAEALRQLCEEIDLDSDTLRSTLEVALEMEGGTQSKLRASDHQNRFRLPAALSLPWQRLVDDTLRLRSPSGSTGALPFVSFEPQDFLEQVGTRKRFFLPRDTALLHLGHPLYHKVIQSFALRRLSLGDVGYTGWVVRRGVVPANCEALILLTVEELAVNELRETFHHWVRTIAIPVINGQLGAPVAHTPARDVAENLSGAHPDDAERARDLWVEHADDLKEVLSARETGLTAHLTQVLASERERELSAQRDTFQSRQGELSALIESNTLKKLEREIGSLISQRDAGWLFDQEQFLAEIDQNLELKQAEIKRRTTHYEELRAELTKERERIIHRVIPRRFTLRGTGRVFPVAVEIRFPAEVQS